MARVRFRRGVDMKSVIKKVVASVILLYVGGTLITEVGNVMNGTTSAFYTGLRLIGWTVSDTGQITATTGTGILSVIGIVAIASVVLEFIEFSF